MANGVAHQSNDFKLGSYYIELKVYKSNEIEHVATRKQFKVCPPTFIGSYY